MSRSLFPVTVSKILHSNHHLDMGSFGTRASYRYFVTLAFILPYIRSSSRVLEIGPGGILCYLYEFSDCRLSGLINPDESDFYSPLRNTSVAIVEHDMNTELPNNSAIRNQMYDVVMFYETLEHLNRWPELVFKDIADITNSDGVLSISVPNLFRITNRLRFIFGIKPSNPFRITKNRRYHVREYCHEEIIEFLSADTWDYLESKYHNQSFPILDKLCRLPWIGRIVGDTIMFNFRRRAR